MPKYIVDIAEEFHEEVIAEVLRRAISKRMPIAVKVVRVRDDDADLLSGWNRRRKPAMHHV